MPTLEALVAEAPPATAGHAVPITYGIGEWRLAFQVADPLQGDNVQWHDLTGPCVSFRWAKGSTAIRGRAQVVQPRVRIVADDDRYAPATTDNSAYFGGTHVPLRAGLLARLVLFRVNAAVVEETFEQWTARVWRWHDTSATQGRYRIHDIDLLGLSQTLNGEFIGRRPVEGWRTRLDSGLATYDFGYDVFAPETVDGAPTVLLAGRSAREDALGEVDATLDPVGLTWRELGNGRLVVHPWPWDTFNANVFAGGGTIVGTPYTNPLDAYYPLGVLFDHTPAGFDVGYAQEFEGGSAGISSDFEQIANQWQVSHPIDVFVPEAGLAPSAHDNPGSSSRYGRRPIPSATWQAQNDQVVIDRVNAQAFADLAVEPFVVRHTDAGAFPAIALLDHLDPVSFAHKASAASTETVVTGHLRRIEHSLRILRDDTSYDGEVVWDTTVTIDADGTDPTGTLETPTGLTIDATSPTTVEFSWTDPGGHAATPTAVQVRILRDQAQWVPLAAAATSYVWEGLRPSTWHEVEVRYVRRVDNIITDVSDRARLVVYTDEQPRTGITEGGKRGDVPDEALDAGETTYWRLEQSFDGATWFLLDEGTDVDFGTDAGGTFLDLSVYNFIDGVFYRLGTKLGDEGEWHYALPYRRNGGQLETVVVELIGLGEAVTAATNVRTEFRVPWPCSIIGVPVGSISGDLSTAGVITIDINRTVGTTDLGSIMSVPITIDANETESTTAAAAAAVSVTELDDGDVLTFDFDTSGTDATGPVLVTFLLERVIGT